MTLNTSDLFAGFRNPGIIRRLARETALEAAKLEGRTIRIMEVCGGHTHTIMKYGLDQILQGAVDFIHGPGCPVCVMPKERIDQAAVLARQENVILCTLGDMIKVPGSHGSLQNIRAEGHDIRFVYSPVDILKIARQNPEKTVIYFAIGFETTTPMTAALVRRVAKEGIGNLLFHINHITVPEPMHALLANPQCRIDAFIGPSHVSVITGAKIYEPFVCDYHKSVVVCGFEPVDVMQGVLMIVRQFIEDRCELEIEYTRSATFEGNLHAQALVEACFERRDHFRWRGLGDIPNSALKLKDEYAHLDAEKVYAAVLPTETIDDHKLCICGKILQGVAKPKECMAFGTACTPQNPLGSCMVSSEGACVAYYRYGEIL